MKAFFIFLLAACSLAAGRAQTDVPTGDDRRPMAVADSVATLSGAAPSVPLSLPLPPVPGARWSDFALMPGFGIGCDTSWRLHEGFNAQFGLSLSAAFGRHAPRGVGFGQNAAFAYVLPLTPRLSVAAGVYAANLDWGPLRHTEGGVAGIVGYRLSDAVSLYAYATHRFAPQESRLRYGAFPLFLCEPKERIGAMAEFKLGKNAMIQVSVERNEY